MILYSYKARDLKGKVQKGRTKALSDAEFYKYLEEANLFCISFVSQNLDKTDSREESLKMNIRTLSVFCREFSVLLSSGMNLMTALQLLYERADKQKQKSCYMRMIESIKKGDTLYQAMSKQGNTFPSLLKAMVLAGESSGSIDLVMAKMALYYEKEERLKAKIQNAMIYPIILIAVTVAVIMILFTFVLPQFFEMLEGQEVPAITTFFMMVSKFMMNYWYIVLIGVLMLIAFIKALSANENAAYRIDGFILQIPVFGKLTEKIIMAHFANAMNILYASGITIIKALEISSATISNSYIEKRLVQVREKVEKGVSLSSALESEKLFDQMFSSMVHIGEESGNLEIMFLKLSEYLEQESENAVQKMMAFLEPTVLILIAVIIGAVVASVLLPIYGMYQV